MTDQKNDLPEMPLTFKSDDDPNIELKILKDDQGDFWLSLRSPDKGMISFRACTIQGGGHRDNRRLWRNLLDFWKHSFDGAKYIRADRPAAVDVEALKLKLSERLITSADGTMHTVPSIRAGINRTLDYLAQHGHLTPAPTGERAEALNALDDLVTLCDDTPIAAAELAAIVRRALSQPVHCTCNGKIPHPLKTGALYPMSAVLCDIAGQEGNDGYPYDTMQQVADLIHRCGQLLSSPVHCTGDTK